ncbi:MAG: hypothetical protein NXH91_02145 [Phyllobacteriaceae bacterium]|nr:hypothetical protein [Phyllobacteriaceae bacterium]
MKPTLNVNQRQVLNSGLDRWRSKDNGISRQEHEELCRQELLGIGFTVGTWRQNAKSLPKGRADKSFNINGLFG